MFKYTSNKITIIDFGFSQILSMMMIQLTPIVSKSKCKRCKPQKVIWTKFMITDGSNFDKQCSDAHFVPLLFYYYCKALFQLTYFRFHDKRLKGYKIMSILSMIKQCQSHYYIFLTMYDLFWWKK